jgi:DNA polymerase-3 subunit beta
MKFTIKVEDLRSALSSLSSIIPKKHFNTYITNTLACVSDSVVAFTGYNEAIQKTVRVECTAQDSMEILFDYNKVNNLSKMLPDGKMVTFTVKDGKLVVSCGKSRSTLSLSDVSSYPSMTIDELTVIDHDPKELSESIDTVFHASDRDNAKHEINGVAMISGNGTVDVVATNTARLSACKLPTSSSESFSMIIPYSSVSSVSKSLAAATNVGTDGRNLVVAGDDFLLVCQLFDGKYVPYDRVIPSDNTITNKLTFSKENMVNALKRIIAIAENSYATTCVITADTGTVDATIQGNNSLGGKDEIIEVIPMTNDSKESFSIGFNPRFIMDALSKISNETVNCTIHSGGFSMLKFSEGNFVAIITKKII